MLLRIILSMSANCPHTQCCFSDSMLGNVGSTVNFAFTYFVMRETPMPANESLEVILNGWLCNRWEYCGWRVHAKMPPASSEILAPDQRCESAYRCFALARNWNSSFHSRRTYPRAAMTPELHEIEETLEESLKKPVSLIWSRLLLL